VLTGGVRVVTEREGPEYGAVGRPRPGGSVAAEGDGKQGRNADREKPVHEHLLRSLRRQRGK
jgi:hypothetical protein